jgi:hypothetical protein
MSVNADLFKTIEILRREAKTEEASERFDVDADNINLEYEFPKRNGKKHTLLLHNGAYSNVFRIRIVEKEASNSNSAVLADWLFVLGDKEQEEFIIEYATLFREITALKYTKSAKDIFLTLCPDLLDEELLNGDFE